MPDSNIMPKPERNDALPIRAKGICCLWCTAVRTYEKWLNDTTDKPEATVVHLDDANWKNFTADKIDFVAAESHKRLEFAYQSRTILRAEAHETLKWLFALIIGSSGLIFSNFKGAPKEALPTWITGPLVALTVGAAFSVWRLLSKGMRAVQVMSPGNEPANLVTNELINGTLENLRHAELLSVQLKIDHNKHYNFRLGRSINQARRAIATLPLLALGLALMWYLVSR